MESKANEPIPITKIAFLTLYDYDNQKYQGQVPIPDFELLEYEEGQAQIVLFIKKSEFKFQFAKRYKRVVFEITDDPYTLGNEDHAHLGCFKMSSSLNKGVHVKQLNDRIMFTGKQLVWRQHIPDKDMYRQNDVVVYNESGQSSNTKDDIFVWGRVVPIILGNQDNAGRERIRQILCD